MTDVTIYFDNRNCIGFELYGHSGFEEEGHDIVCAAISSAAMMTINGIGEVLKQDMDLNIEEQGPRIKLRLLSGNDCARAMLESFAIHMDALKQQYPKNIKLRNLEV